MPLWSMSGAELLVPQAVRRMDRSKTFTAPSLLMSPETGAAGVAKVRSVVELAVLPAASREMTR